MNDSEIKIKRQSKLVETIFKLLRRSKQKKMLFKYPSIYISK